MIISVNWLKKYLDFDVSINDLVSAIGSRLVEIEGVTSLKEKYDSATVVKVISCEPHPDSDHLHVCLIDDGGRNNNIERSSDGYVQVVCGAPNVRQGLLAVWLPPTSIVPETYGSNEEFRLSDRKLRGVLSHGMMASPKELGLWDEHEGIMEVDDETATPGTSLTDLLELDDYLLEVENKSLTHRPDCFGIIGFAREVAAIFNHKAKLPDWFDASRTISSSSQSVAPRVIIDDTDLCSRYQCIALELPSNGISKQLPDKIRSKLTRLGVKSISALVDITNLLMIESGQPLHAYDLDKIIELSPTGKPDVIVRSGRDKETLTLLDGRVIDLTQDDIVVCAGDNTNSVPIALAGAMGGQSTEVSSSTKRVLLESATFNLYKLRSTQFRHGIFTEAITRFTKGQPSGLTNPVLIQAADLSNHYVGSSTISQMVDCYPAPAKATKFNFPIGRVSDLLGEIDGGYDYKRVAQILSNLGYSSISENTDRIMATSPWWRTDLHIQEDVIEDIGRVAGYDNINQSLPLRNLSAISHNINYSKSMLLRDRLSRSGGNEVSTYSFVPGDLLDKVHDDKSRAYRIVNAISPDLQYYRRSLLPSLLDKSRDNLRAGYDDFMLFELGKVHSRGNMDPIEITLPAEIPTISGLMTSSSKSGSAFYYAKRVVDYALGSLGDTITYHRLDQTNELDPSTRVFEPTRSAAIYLGEPSGRQVYAGVVGEIKLEVLRQFKLPKFTAGFNLLIDKLSLSQLSNISYHPVPRFQGTSRDVTYQVTNNVSYQTIYDFTKSSLQHIDDDIVVSIDPLDIYQPGESLKNITLRINFYDRTKTIDPKAVAKIMSKLSYTANHINAKII